MRDLAQILRTEIKDAKKTPLPMQPTVEDVIHGEIEVPALLTEFLTMLIHGPDENNPPCNTKKVRIDSIAKDIVYAATNGRKVSGKHLELGMVVKSLTGCKKMLEILNR